MARKGISGIGFCIVAGGCGTGSLFGLCAILRKGVMKEMELRVECYAGYRGEETPHAFYLGERRIEVLEVLDRWLAPDHRYFKIKGGDGGVYILRHDVESGKWELTLFEGRAQEE